MSVLRRLAPSRVAMLSVHTSPLDQPGTGDAGGMNVYIVETARRLAQFGVEVEIFTRATSGSLPATVDLAPGVGCGPPDGEDERRRNNFRYVSPLREGTRRG